MRATHGCPFGNPAYRALFGAIRARANAHFVPLHRRQGPHGRGGGAHPQALGVSREDIVEDYLLTNACRTTGRDQFPRNAGAGGTPAAQAQQVTEIATGVRRESIESALDAIEEKISVF